MTFDYKTFEGFTEEGRSNVELLDVRGAKRTSSLFVDTIVKSSAKTMIPVYTMSDVAKGNYPSAYQIYMNSNDEYDAAMKMVGSMRHWRKLCLLDWFLKGTDRFDGLESWRLDMLARDASAAKKTLLSEVGEISAARKLFDVSTPKKVKDVAKKDKRTTEGSSRLSLLHKAKIVTT